MAFSSPYNFSSDLRIDLPTATADLDLAMWGDNYNYYHAGVPVPNILEYDHDVESPGSMTSFPDRLIGIFDMVVPTYLRSSMAESETDHFNFNQYSQLLEGEYCCGLVSNFWPVYPAAANHNVNFEIKETKTAKEVEEATMKVGKYSVEERKDKIMKYLKKRNQRNFNKTIKYACRKTLADKRVRVRGRFAKNNEPCEEQHQTLRKNNYVHAEEPDLFYDGCVQMKEDYYEEEREEDWLELEAMESLLYSPCILMD